jgi:hypothetical protein
MQTYIACTCSIAFDYINLDNFEDVCVKVYTYEYTHTTYMYMHVHVNKHIYV